MSESKRGGRREVGGEGGGFCEREAALKKIVGQGER